MARGDRTGDLTVGSARVGARVVCTKLPGRYTQDELTACGCEPLVVGKYYVIKTNADTCVTFAKPAFVKLEGCDQVMFPHNLFNLAH